MLLVAAVGVGLSGCQPYERVVRDDWAKFADDARAGGADVSWGGRQQQGDAASEYLRQRRARSYTVYLAAHEGDDRMAAAFRDATWLRSEGGVPDVWFAEADGVAGVYAGRFSRQDDPRAAHIVRTARAVTRGDESPYADAKVVAVDGGGRDEVLSPLDLRTHAGQFAFTLQIGAFLADFSGDRREAAEQWVRDLRTEHEGLEAFYYHGPHRSMVTVGLFTESDRVWVPGPNNSQVRGWGPKIKEMQARFPHNVVNGMTVVEKSKADGESLGEQESSLVRIPR